MAGCATHRAPSSSISLYVQGVHQYQSGDVDHAVRSLQQAADENDTLVMARALLGDLYRSRGQYADAAIIYEQLTHLDPCTASNFYHLGVVDQFLQRLNDAVVAYRRALALDPHDARSQTNLGLAYLSLGRAGEAVASLRHATALDPKNAAAWSDLAVALQVSGDNAGAEAAYRTSLDLSPDQPQVLVDLAATLVAQRRPAEAAALLDTFLARHRDAGAEAYARKIYGDAYAVEGKTQQAIRQYDQAAALSPRYAAALAAKGDALIADYQHGVELDDAERQTALAAWRASLALDPNQPRVSAALTRWGKDGI